MNTLQFYIGGAWVRPDSADVMDIINPANGEACGKLALGNRTDVDLAVAAAVRAFDSWSATAPAERKAVLQRVVEVYRRRSDEIADAIMIEMGAPKGLARGPQAGSGLGHLEDFIRAMDDIHWERPLFPGDTSNQIVLEAKGVAALITPWNWPMNQVTLKVGAALAAGCTMVLKPSEFAPLSAALFAEVLDEAGVPAGVFNLVHGTGVAVGERLSSHPDVAVISLTGSTRAGVAVSKAAAETVKRVGLELGGKGADIIFDDCNVEAAAEATARHMFRNSGQSCNAPSRMLVQRKVYEQAVAAAARVAKEVRVGDPAIDRTEMGPVVNAGQFGRIRGLIEAGIQEGARLVAGGADLPEGINSGYFIRPTVFADVHNGMTVAREEIFGPVLTILPFDTEEEAIEIANDSVYGLAAYLWTDDAEKARRVSRKLRAGMVRLNGTDLPYGAPFGGFGQSGIGREGGVWGIEEYLEVKAISGWPNAA
ncbi:aldehyde dehydrogenase family protein [Rhizobium sp. AG855]|uniref:aldehyde dehydrogenase family protein n=1 Tax=Rhizobium sp. AG855 TaxID=2183898 RepID=UPI000E72730C|nr:aldehyde dehydrogenase family protein [Rhizobium sp. AG855]RKE83342.1 aldehyde dehydrogenase (NAD+) [Rhizobium sp. AG855]